MKEAIKKGDLVVVTGTGCKCQERDIGLIMTVEGVTFEDRVGCIYCGFVAPQGLCAEFIRDGRHAWKPLPWLKKIDPPAEQSTTDTPAELFA